MLETGQQLGEFEILGLLGKGGMGAVYKARQTTLRRLVALKLLQPSLASDESFITRFHNEAVAAAGLNHPNLVQVYAAGQTGDLHWFAMEFVDGEPLQSRLDRLGKIDAAEAIAVVMHVANALEYGWRKARLIHRDIKPDNIFLSSDGEVKLGDLGLAKSIDQENSLTMTGAAMGTPLYISPEQAEGKRDIDFRTDIYSLGASLYHLLAGAPPFTGDSSISVMMKHVGAPVPDIRLVDPKLPAALSALLAKMMQKSPADRHASYQELGAELHHAYEAFTSPTSSPPAAQELDTTAPSRVAPKKNRAALFLPAVALPLLGVAAYALLKSKDPNAEEKSPSAATMPRKPVEKERSKAAKDSVLTLVQRLEAKLLPVPGTDVLMGKTELTVGEWKIYLQEQALPEWKQPTKHWHQTDEHPVVNIEWGQAQRFCEWISEQTGKVWRLPSNAEWDAAVGRAIYPWGDYYPPNWDDGNYSVLDDGKPDPRMVGKDGIHGTTPVGSFKPNQLGFYDLGGNAFEWVWDAVDEKGFHIQRGSSWIFYGEDMSRSSFQVGGAPGKKASDRGFRVVQVKQGTGEKGPAAP